MNAIVSNFKTKNQRLVICSSADGIPETPLKEEEKKNYRLHGSSAQATNLYHVLLSSSQTTHAFKIGM